MRGEIATAKAEYKNSQTIWKDPDSDIPTLKEANERLFAQFSVGAGRLPFQPVAKCEWSELGERNASLPDETP